MSLDTQQLQLIEAKVAHERRSVGLAYLFWFFLGGLGVHNFYLGKVKLAAFQFLGWVVALILISIAGRTPDDIGPLAFVGVVLLLIWGLTFLADLFLIPGRVRAHTEGLRAKFAAELGATSPVTIQR